MCLMWLFRLWQQKKFVPFYFEEIIDPSHACQQKSAWLLLKEKIPCLRRSLLATLDASGIPVLRKAQNRTRVKILKPPLAKKKTNWAQVSDTGWIKSSKTANNSTRKPHYSILFAAEAPAAITIISSTTSRNISSFEHGAAPFQTLLRTCDADGFAPIPHLVFRGAGRQQNLLRVKELGQRLGDGSSALVGHLVHQSRRLVHRFLLLGEKSNFLLVIYMPLWSAHPFLVQKGEI